MADHADVRPYELVLHLLEQSWELGAIAMKYDMVGVTVRGRAIRLVSLNRVFKAGGREWRAMLTSGLAQWYSFYRKRGKDWEPCE